MSENTIIEVSGIPKLIHRFWLPEQEPIDGAHTLWGDQWAQTYEDKGWQVRLWGPDHVEDLEWMHEDLIWFYENQATHDPRLRLMVMRLCVLWAIGGWVVPGHSEPSGDLGQLCEPHDMVLCFNGPYAQIMTDFMGAVPRCQLVEIMARNIIDYYNRKKNKGPRLDIGPILTEVADYTYGPFRVLPSRAANPDMDQYYLDGNYIITH